MDGLSWEEKYLRLRDDHTSLTHKANEQDDTIRRMNTKLSQIEKSLKLKYRLDKDGNHGAGGGGAPTGGVGSAGVGGDGGGFGHPRNRENEQLVEELHRYNGSLLRENSDLKTKIKSLTDALTKKKKELVTARLARTRAVGAGPAGPRSPCSASRAAGMRTRHVQLGKKRSADDMDMGTPNLSQDQTTRKLSELVEKLRERVSNAEQQLKSVRTENQRLRQDKLDAGCAPEDAHEQAVAAAAAARREHQGGRDQEEVETLHRELREAQAKAQLIQARFDHLEARTLAQADLHEGTVDKLQETNRQLRDVRRELQDILHERDVAVARGATVDDLEETVLELRRHNKELEDQVTRLCESPFISQAFRDQERSERVLELEQGGRAAQLKIDHLQETAQTHHAALVTLQKQTVRLKEEKMRAERALQEMRARHNETEAGAQLMADKMRLYAGDEDIDLEELERALTIVRRKMANPESFPGFLDNPEDEDMDNVPALRRKLQRVQVSNLNLTREVERAERMLKAQMSINRDLHVELEEACRRSTLDRGELGQKLRDFEALALERLTTVHRLEAQVKQLLYGPARRQRLGAAADASSAAMEQEQESALLSELAEGDFSADQNIVEVWVVAAELEPGVLSAGSSSFMVVDFFDFESQATPLVPGVSPAFDFATTFKVTVDDFFLRYLGTEGLVLELNQARAADFELVGRRQVALAGLLSSKPRIVLQREPLISTRDGAVVGYVHVEVRMALPVTELYALFLERRPEEKERVHQARLLEAKAHGYLTSTDVPRTRNVVDDTSRLRNELEVVVVGCRGLRARGRGDKDVAPSAYAHYQLLGFQDVFTPVVHGSRDPSFHHTTSFPVATDDKLLRFLARHRLTVTIMDDRANNDDSHDDEAWPSGEASEGDESEGLIGEALIDLSPLADGGLVIAQWAAVEDATGRPAGYVSISARWIKPLRTGGDPGPHGLSAEEVEGLMERFSPEKDGQVQYVAFLQQSDPPPAVLAALSQTHAFLAEAAEKDGLSATEALGAVLGVGGSDPKARVSEETFISALLSSGKFNASPDELAAAYGHAAGGGNGSNGDASRELTLEQLAGFAAYGVPSVGTSERGSDGAGWASWVGAARPGDGGAPARRAIVKARIKCRDAGLLGRSFPGEAFAKLDREGSGRISRPAFKRALREMGFALIDEAPESNDPAGSLFGSTTQRQLPGEEGEGRTGRGGILGSMGEEDAGKDDEEVRLRRVEGEEEDDARRKAFREKVGEIERSTAEKVNAAEALSGRQASQGDGEKEEGVEPRVAKFEDDGNETGLHHPSSTVAHDSCARVRPETELGRDSAATVLQSRFRGYHLRKHGISGGGVGSSTGGTTENIANQGGEEGGRCSVLDLEDFIDEAFERFEGACALPDLLATFAKLDKESTGFLDRPRFALALRSLRPSLELPPPLLRTAMNLFDTDNGEAGGGGRGITKGVGRGGSGRIDYRAFTIFCENRQRPEVSSALTLLRSKVLHPGALDVFSRRDSLGTDFVCRVDLFDGLRELGISGTPPTQLRHLATVFEEAEDMVDYASLVAFASEQPAALRVEAAVSRLRGHLLALRNSKGVDLRAALEAFVAGDTGSSGGILRQSQLDSALQELGFRCTEDEKSLLYKRLDPAGTGVSCRDLVSFVEAPASGDNHLPDMALVVMPAEGGEEKLLRRAQATIVEAAQRMDTAFEAFDHPYLRYDWQRTGRVGTAEFIRSTIRCGFPFTRAQAASLAGVFGDGRDVAYPAFLSWATPGPDGLAASGRDGAAAVNSRRRSASPTLERRADRNQRGSSRDRRVREGNTGEDLAENEAELKVRTALQRMGEAGVSKAWDEFERMDPGGKRGGVHEEELVEVLAMLGLPVTARDVASLMRRFSESNRGEVFFLYPHLLQSVAGGEKRGRPGHPEDILRNVKAELRRLVRRSKNGGHSGSGGDERPAALRAFESLDRDGSGRVSRRDFRRALEGLGFNSLGDEEARKILNHFDQHRDGRIRYEDFLGAVEEGEDQPYSDGRNTAGRGRSPGALSASREYGGGFGTSEQGRLRATLSRAIDRGIDYRREMELEEGGAGGGVEEGVVSRESFRSTMKMLRVDLSEMELQGLEKRFSSPSGGTSGISASRGRAGGARGVRYVELLHWGAPGRRAKDGSDETWALEERFRQMIRRRFDVWIPGALKKAFRHFDVRRKGKVSETDLSDGLRRLGFELTAGQERALFKAMDLDGAGFIVYPDLVVFTRDPNHGYVLDKILGQLSRITDSQIRAELEHRDPSASGVISEQTLGKALKRLGADLAGADSGRLMHRFDVHEDGMASIERVISCLAGRARGDDEDRRIRRRDSESDGGEALEDAREKLREAFKFGAAGRMSPRRLFEYLDPEGIGELRDTDLRMGLKALGAQLTRQETRLLVGSSGATTGSTSAKCQINLRQFSRLLDGAGVANASSAQGKSRRYSESPESRPRTNPASRRSKGVTFRDDGDGDDGAYLSSTEALRVSLRRLVDHEFGDATGAGTPGGRSVGPVLRDKLRGALNIAGEARGARRGRHVDRETIRRAMSTCGASLSPKVLGDLERRFDRGGTGDVGVEEFVNYVAEEVEADIWGRVAAEMTDMLGRGRGLGGHDRRGRGGIARAFIDDLTRVVDGREEISRRELRKALERQGVSGLGEAEVLVLCDSIDLERRGRVRLSDVSDKINRGMAEAGLSSAREYDSDDGSSTEAAAIVAAAALDELRRLVHGAERERGIDLLESFERSDRRGQGEVSEVEFWEGLQTLGLDRDLPLWHASRVVDTFKGKRSGSVRYRDFVKAMGDPSSPRGARGGRRKGRESEYRRRSSADDIERLVDRLKEEIGRLTEEEDGPPPFRKVFKAADRRGFGTLPPLAFRRCLLEELGFDLTEAECEDLLEYLDTGGDGNISYREFLQFVGHEVRERTPPRSRSPRRARSATGSSAAARGDGAGFVSDGNGDSRDDFVLSPPRRRQHSSPSMGGGGSRRRSKAHR